MNVEPLISVLMNCRNEEKLISKSIKSVLVQSYKNLELIIWDDASNDNTVNIIQSFKDKRIKLFNNKTHLGLGPSRRQAIKEIKGNFVAILDADDEMEDSRIEKQVNEFKNNEKLALVGTWIRFKDIDDKIISEPFYNKNFNILRNKEQIRETMLSKNIIANSSIMYKKENAEEVWYSNDLEYSQDYDLSLKLIKSYDFKILTEFLTYITVRKENDAI